MINVTKTFFPPIQEYNKQVQRIWKNEWLTNRGELVQELEAKLKSHLDTSSILLMTNGTLPIQIALKILGGQGEIITTPFSYVATTSSILWENCKPVFVDIDAQCWTIDENLIEAAITEKTTCILATHVFGNPCNVEAIDRIAKKHNLYVIYDAAHAFGVIYNNKSLFEHGDVSTCSFHATKVFHTGEGGALFCNDKDLMHKLFYSHNFGHDGPLDFHGVGINAKISELQAAMGLSVLPYMDDILRARKYVVKQYDNHLDFSKLKSITLRENTVWNYAYYPVVFESEQILLKVQKSLNRENINPRRYFYPSLNTLGFTIKSSKPVSEALSSRIMCLPLYAGLKKESIDKIISIINTYS